MHSRFSPEVRRAIFRALVVASDAGEPEVTSQRVVAALIYDPDVASICEESGATDADWLKHLRNAEISLSERNVEFGSHEHIDSLHPIPLAPEAQDIIWRIDAAFKDSSDVITPLDLLEEFMRREP